MIAVYAPGSCRTSLAGSTYWDLRSMSRRRGRGRPQEGRSFDNGDPRRAGRLSTDRVRNTASAAVLALLQRLENHSRDRLDDSQGLPLARGIGSSGASAVAAVVAPTNCSGARRRWRCCSVRDGRRAGRMRLDPSRQRTHRRYTADSSSRAAPSRPISSVAGAERPGLRGCASPDADRDRPPGVCWAIRSRWKGRRGNGRMWARSWQRLHMDLALLSRSLVDHIAEAEASLARAGFAEINPPRGRPARLAAACGIGSVDLLARPHRSISRKRRARPCRRAFTATSDVGFRFVGVPVGRQGARVLATMTPNSQTPAVPRTSVSGSRPA